MGNKIKTLYYEFERYETFTDDEWRRITNEWTTVKEVLDFQSFDSMKLTEDGKGYSHIHGLHDASYCNVGVSDSLYLFESIGITYKLHHLSGGIWEEFVILRDGADTEGWNKDMHTEHYDEIYYSVLANPRSAAGLVIRHMLLFIEKMASGKLKNQKPLAFERSKIDRVIRS